MRSGLSEQEVEQYFADGFLYGLRLLPEDEANSRFQVLRDEIYTILSQPESTVENLHYFPWEKKENPLYPLIDELVRGPQLLDMVSSLIGDDLLVRNCDIFMKHPIPKSWPDIDEFASESGEITWHSDELTGEIADKVLTVWIALTASTELNGCVRYIRGSHRVPIPDPITDRSDLSYHGERLQYLDGCERVPATLAPGEISIHHGNVVHGSLSNFAQRPRLGVAIRYLANSVPPDFSGSNAVAQVRGEREKNGYQIRSTYMFNWWVPRTSNTGTGWILHDDTTWYPEDLAPNGDLGSLSSREDGGYTLEIPCIVKDGGPTSKVPCDAGPPLGWNLTSLAEVHAVAIAVYPESSPRKEANLYVPPVAHRSWRGEELAALAEWSRTDPHNGARLPLALDIPPKDERVGNKHRLECICALENRLYQHFSLTLSLE